MLLILIIPAIGLFCLLLWAGWSKLQLKRPTLAIVYVVALVAIAAFFSGRFFQDLRNGYELKEVSRKEYEFKPGRLTKIEAFETVGFGFMTPMSTVLEFEGRTLFKAAPFFQESFPCFKNLEIKDNELNWTDGKFDYRLFIEKKGPNEKPLAVEPKK